MIGISSKIRVLKKPDVTDLAGEKVMIDFESGKYFVLTGAANDVWDFLSDDTAVSEIVERLIELYDVEREKCESSTLGFLEKLADIGFIALEQVE